MSRSVKVLPKGQVTLPSKIRKKLNIHIGDTLILDEIGDVMVLKKGKTIFDFTGILPESGMTVGEMREKAMEEVARERSKSNR